MDQPPDIGDPYQLVDQTVQYPGTSGVAVAWDGLRYFYGTVINQAWFDMDVIQGNTGGLV